MKTTEILTSINAFMGQMRDGNTRELIANLQAALDYQTEKLRIYEEKYKAETGKDRPELTDDERRRLAKRGRAMNQYLLSITENTWSPSTVMGWYSKLIAEKYDSTGPDQKTRGRKPITDDLKALILRLAEQNPSWGYKRIRDYAVYLGYEVSFMTVKRIMNKLRIFPSDRWKNKQRLGNVLQCPPERHYCLRLCHLRIGNSAWLTAGAHSFL